MNGGHALTLLGALAFGVLIPWAVVRTLVPVLSDDETAMVVNFRGRAVVRVLGVAWLAWSVSVIVIGSLFSGLRVGSGWTVLWVGAPLALVAFAAGMFDDAYGSSASKGFRGHLKAMIRGRLTTGGLKLLSVGVASLVAAVGVSRVAPWAAGSETLGSVRGIAGVALAGAAIALSSNLVNLMDLRPGRALKSYLLLAALGVVSSGFLLVSGSASGVIDVDTAVTALALGLFLIGPVIAVWHYDLGELGMLGDAGANPMGAVAGLFIIAGLTFSGLVAYVVFVFALNLASEKVSFSRVIESNFVLRWIDSLGRRAD